MKNRLLTLLIAAAMLLTPAVAFADDEADNAANPGADKAIESGAAASDEDAAIDEETAENTENAESTDEDELVQLSPKGLGVASIGAKEEEWTAGWNADRTQYKYEDGEKKGTIATGLFKALQPDKVGALYYADDNGMVRKYASIITVPGNKTRFRRTENQAGSIGFREVPASDTNAYTYYITSAGNGEFIVDEKSGIIDCNGGKYFVQNDGTVQTTAGFIDANGARYFVQPGGPIRTAAGWIDFNGKRYLAGNGGVLNMTVGLINYGGDLYVLQADHSVCTNIGIARVGANLYYVSNSSGVLARNRSIKVGKKTCHVQANGIVAVGSHKWKKKWYYSTADGYLKTKAGIVKYNGKRFYVKKGGKVQVNKKFKYKKKTYVAGKDGAFKTGVFKWKGAMYYASKKGVVRTKAGMVTYKNYSYYVRSGGKIYKNTQFKAGGKTYLADSKGHLVSGIYKWKGKYYYADASYAVRRTAGIIKVKGKYYYNKKGGGLAKNKFVKYNDAYYYAGSDAVIKTSTFTYKGITITPSSSGVVSEDDYYRVFPEKKNNTSTDPANTSTNSAA